MANTESGISQSRSPRSFLIVDASNLFHRAKHVTSGSIDDRLGMSLHIIFSSIGQMWKKFNGDHVVFCFDNGSWRRELYSPYKANRRDKPRTSKEQKEDALFIDMFDQFRNFIHATSNATVLDEPNCEADDFVARWIHRHPNDSHVIISNDSDFYQLINDNVCQYSGVARRLMTIDGVFDDNDEPIVDNKTGTNMKLGDPKWLLFEKIIRGDSTDNIFSAYPGVRKKGTRNKIGLIDAYEDMENRGYNWNNLMLQKWTDHHDDEHIVRDDYHRNEMLIDLTKQPDNIKKILDDAIDREIHKEEKGSIGGRFLKFCGKHSLIRLSDTATEHVSYLKARYGN